MTALTEEQLAGLALAAQALVRVIGNLVLQGAQARMVDEDDDSRGNR